MTDQSSLPSARKKVHALLLGDRIDTSGLERTDVLSTTPLSFRAGQDGVVTVFRYGVVVLFGMSLLEEDEVVRGLRSRIRGRGEEGRTNLAWRPDFAPVDNA